jgi:hypothetical protein
MIAWSEPGPAFTVPAGPIDVYQSIQRLEPGAWVAAHTHEGPESGVVIAGAIARHEAGATRAFARGATFCTPAGAVHATGNPGPHVAEAITLHVVRAGSTFSTLCPCATAPPPQPGSTNPARSIVRGAAFPAAPLRARHARLTLGAPFTLEPQTPLPAVITVLAGRLIVDATTLPAAAFLLVPSARTFAPDGGPAEVLLTRFEAAAA